MIWIVLLLTAPVWARTFGYRPKPAGVSRNRTTKPKTGPAWEQDTPWVLDLALDTEQEEDF